MQLYLAWMTYFYLTMALRECVLLVNGSQIRAWWVQHHYWSAGCSLIMLALPVSSPSELHCCVGVCLGGVWDVGLALGV